MEFIKFMYFSLILEEFPFQIFKKSEIISLNFIEMALYLRHDDV
jgi:hypothetical protein